MHVPTRPGAPDERKRLRRRPSRPRSSALRSGASALAAAAFLLGALVAVAPTPSVRAASNLVMGPVVAANASNDNATKRFTTIVIRGENLPVAPISLIGQETRKFVQVNNVTKGFLIGGVNAGDDCAVLVGASSPTELVIGVGNMDGGVVGFSCFGFRTDYIVYPGDVVEVKLFDPVSGQEIPGTTVRGAPATAPPSGAVPELTAMTPPFGPMTGGNEVVATTPPGSLAPQAFWFGGYSPVSGWYGTATTNITPAGGNNFKVVPPAFISAGTVQNYGVSVFSADAAAGISSQNCNVLVTGCANEYLYLSSNKGSIEEFDLSVGVPGFNINPYTKSIDFPVGTASAACGLAAGTPNTAGASVSITAGFQGKAKMDYDVGVSYSNANVPQAVVGKGTLTVVEPITFNLTLAAQVGGCVEVPIPGLSIPGGTGITGGLYIVIGGKIEGNITLQVKLAKGTYSFTGGWVPPVAGRDDTGGFGLPETECFDDAGNKVDVCVTTEVTAGVRGTLIVSPLWLQLGVDVPSVITAKVGAGLSAAAVIDATFTGWPPVGLVSWGVCGALRWAAEVDIASVVTASYGGNLLGPYNVLGDGSLCPFGAAADPPRPQLSATRSTVTAAPATVVPDGGAASTVTVTLLATDGSPVVGQQVNLAGNAGSSSTISAASGPSDANGVVTFTVTNTTAEAVTYTATAGGVAIAQTAVVTFAADTGPTGPGATTSATNSTVVSSPTQVAADGVESSIVTVTLLDADDTPVPGKTVTLAGGPGTSSVISAASGPSDASGVVTFTVTNNVEEAVTYTATDTSGPVLIDQTAQVTFTNDTPGSDFTSLAPARVLDSRPDQTTVDGDSNGIGKREAGSTTELQVGGRGGVAADASSAVLNLTVVAPDTNGYVTVYPCGSERPNASNVNYRAGRTIANVVVAKIGVDGKVCIFTSASAHLIADVKDGYFPTGSTYAALVPARLLDSRAGRSTVDGELAGIGTRDAGSTTEVTVLARGGVAVDATAVVLNVAAIGPTDRGYITVYPCGTERPNASNLNFDSGQTIANVVVTKVGVDGKVCIFSSAATDLLGDVSGSFGPGSTYASLDPARLADSRAGRTTVDGESAGIGVRAAESVTEVQVTGRAGVDPGAVVAVLNITAVAPEESGFLTVFPCGTERPTASNVNYIAGQTIANAAFAKIGDGGKVCIFAKSGTHLLVDVYGAF